MALVREDQIDTVLSDFTGAGIDNRQLALKGGAVTEEKLGFTWATLEIPASSFSYDATRSNYTLAQAASSNANVLDMAQLLTNGVDGLSRVATTSASGEWSVAGLTLSIHGDITYTGATFKLRYVVGTSSGAASSSGNQIWLGTADLITIPASPTVDLTARFGSVLLQPPESTTAEIRTPLSLADGEEIVVSMSRPYAQGAGGNNDIAYGVSFNDATTGYEDGAIDWFYWDGGNEELDHWDGTVVSQMNVDLHPGGNFYWRFIRSGDDIVAFFSLDGQVWCAFSEVDTVVRGHTQFWIFYKVEALTGSKKVGPMEVRWCRHKTYDGIYPW